MKKEIRQITGTSLGITFTKLEQKIHNIKLGSVIDISDMVIINNEDNQK